MKKLTTLLFLLCSITIFSQKGFQGKATYMSKSTMDMSRWGKNISEQRKKQIMARAKNFLEKTFILEFTQTESSWKEEVKLDAPGSNGGFRWGGNSGKGSIYKNLKQRVMIEDTEQFSKRFLITEKMEQPQWELTGETRKIGNYTAYKAILKKEDKSVNFGRIFGRRTQQDRKNDSLRKLGKLPPKMLNVTAWYTMDIPISSGPADYWGLPGLILELSAGRTTMLCTEIVINPTEKVEIKQPTKGKEVTREEYNKIIKQKAQEARERFRRGRGGRGRRF